MSRYDLDEHDAYVIIEKHDAGIGSFLVGLAVGAGVALLFAPRAGVEDIDVLDALGRLDAGDGIASSGGGRGGRHLGYLGERQRLAVA